MTARAATTMVSPVMMLRQNTPPTEPSGLRSSAVATVSSSLGMPALMTCLRRKSMNGTPELPCMLAATLRILPGAGDDLSGVVAPKIKPGLLKLRIVGVLDPLAAATRPVLIDQELIVVLDQELRGIAGVLFGIAEQAAGDDQVAGEQRRTAFADQSLADDQGLDAAALQVERRVTTRGATAHNHDIGGDRLHCKI